MVRTTIYRRDGRRPGRTVFCLFQGNQRPLLPHLPARKAADEVTRGTTRKEIYLWQKLRGLLARMSESDRRLLLHMARKMARPELARHKKGWASHSRGTEILRSN